MSTRWELAFDALYRAQTAALGTTVLATVGNFAQDKPAILGTAIFDESLIPGGGGTAEAGGYTLQMKMSDFSGVPPKQTSVVVNGDAAGFSLEIATKDRANGIYMIRVMDYAATAG